MVALLAESFSGWGFALLALAGLYTTGTVGVTGGPNHGEHPFIVNVLHLAIAASWGLRSWTRGPYWTYLGLLGVAIALSVAVISLRASSQPGKVWAGRAGMAALYAGLLAVVLWGRGA